MNSNIFAFFLETLKCIHLLGKEGVNVFSSVQELKHQVDPQSSKDVACHPLYGFKKNLVRLIGNVCCGCKDNQDLVNIKNRFFFNGIKS